MLVQLAPSIPSFSFIETDSKEDYKQFSLMGMHLVEGTCFLQIFHGDKFNAHAQANPIPFLYSWLFFISQLDPH